MEINSVDSSSKVFELSQSLKSMEGNEETVKKVLSSEESDQANVTPETDNVVKSGNLEDQGNVIDMLG